MARPRFIPTVEQRRTVRTMTGLGLRQEDIAACLDIRSAKTLRRHFRAELDRGAPEANARVAQTLYQMAISGKCPQATIYWMKTRVGWRDREPVEPIPIERPPFLVVMDKEAA
jgi:hypothetical protein